MTKRFQKKVVEEVFDLPVWEWEYVGKAEQENKKEPTHDDCCPTHSDEQGE